MVEEPTVEDTVSILRGIKEKYELHHGADFRQRAGCRRDPVVPLHHRPFPCRDVIDLVDEAASRRMEVDLKPEELDAIDREILQKQIEAEALEEGRRRGVQGSAGKAGKGTVRPLQYLPR